MFYFFLFIQFVLFIALIVGLITPSLVLGWLKNPSRWKVLLFYFSGFIIIGVLTGVTTANTDYSQNYVEKAEGYLAEGDLENAYSELQRVEPGDEFFDKAAILVKKTDSLKQVKAEENKIAEALKLTEDLKGMLAELEEGKVTFGRESIEDLQISLLLFSTYAQKILEGEQSEDAETKSAAAKLKKKVQSIQVKEFPLIRKAYAEHLDNKLWEFDMEVFCNGTGSRYINLTGGHFAANRNIKDTQVELQEVLKEFRFKQSRFRWYDGDSEFTYYEIESPGDDELVVLVGK